MALSDIITQNYSFRGAVQILIVDDEKSVVESVKLMLENMGVDVEIETAFNGIEAGIKLIQFSPHLVILDAIMPRF